MVKVNALLQKRFVSSIITSDMSLTPKIQLDLRAWSFYYSSYLYAKKSDPSNYRSFFHYFLGPRSGNPFFRGFCSIGFFPKGRTLQPWLSPHAEEGTLDDWTMIGKDLCDVMAEYTMSHSGNLAESSESAESCRLR